jgi:hypothetical protein
MSTEMIKFKKDVKPIIDAIDNLSSWDKSDLINYLVMNQTSEDYESTREECGFNCELDEDACIQNVIDNGNQNLVLDDMDPRDIVDYILDHLFSVDRTTALSYLFNQLDGDDLLEIIEDIDKKFIPMILEKIRKDFPKEMIKWLHEKLDLPDNTIVDA